MLQWLVVLGAHQCGVLGAVVRILTVNLEMQWRTRRTALEGCRKQE